MSKEKKDPYAVERKPPIISHIAGRRLRNESAFGQRHRPGGPIAARSRKFKGIEPPSPVKPENRERRVSKPTNMTLKAAGSPDFEYEEPTERVDIDELPDGTKLKFDGDPRIHEYAVILDKNDKVLGKVRRVTYDTDKMKTEWEATDGEWSEIFPSRLVAARALFGRLKEE